MSTLPFDWEVVSHSKVLSVIGRDERRMNDGSLRWDEIAFVIGKMAIHLAVNEDTDEVIVSYAISPQGDDWLEIASLDFVVGMPLGYCWLNTNSLGYSDGFTLAFGDMVPEVLEPKLTFLGEASSLCCYKMAPVTG
jgi:hypothetical protein